MTGLKAIAILALVCLALGQVDLKTEFCTLIENTTPQVVMSLETTGADVQGQKVMHTQSFISGTDNLRLIYYEKDGNLNVDAVNEDLVIQTSSDDISRPVHYIDGKDQYILGREIVNAAEGQVQYVLFEFIAPGDPLQKTILQSDIDANPLNDMQLWNLTKIISIEDDIIYVIGNSASSTALFTIDTSLTNSFAFAYYLDESLLLDITNGNSKVIFDQTCGGFFNLDTDTDSFVFKTPADLQIDNALTGDIINVELSDGASLSFTHAEGLTKIIQIDATDLINTTPLEIQGDVVVYSDYYRNVVFATKTDFIWIRIVDGVPVHFQLSQSELTAEEKTALLNIFGMNLLFGGFDKDLLTIVYVESEFSEKGSIALIKFDSEASTVEILNDEKHIYDVMNGEPNLKTKWTSAQIVQNKYSCSCVSDQVKKIQCFDTEMKCIAVTVPKREECTIAPAI